MKLTEIARASDCKNGSCPAVYFTDNPDVLVVQGTKLDASTTAGLIGVGDDELGIAIPRETLLRALAQLDGRA